MKEFRKFFFPIGILNSLGFDGKSGVGIQGCSLLYIYIFCAAWVCNSARPNRSSISECSLITLSIKLKSDTEIGGGKEKNQRCGKLRSEP